jgi:hypothetical protein
MTLGVPPHILAVVNNIGIGLRPEKHPRLPRELQEVTVTSQPIRETNKNRLRQPVSCTVFVVFDLIYKTHYEDFYLVVCNVV